MAADLEGAEGDLALIQKLLVAHAKMAQLKITQEIVDEITNQQHASVRTALPGSQMVDPERAEGPKRKDEKAIKIMSILYRNFTIIGHIMYFLKILKQFNQVC